MFKCENKAKIYGIFINESNDFFFFPTPAKFLLQW